MIDRSFTVGYGKDGRTRRTCELVGGAIAGGGGQLDSDWLGRVKRVIPRHCAIWDTLDYNTGLSGRRTVHYVFTQ